MNALQICELSADPHQSNFRRLETSVSDCKSIVCFQYFLRSLAFVRQKKQVLQEP
jgi:hypothetical protein